VPRAIERPVCEGELPPGLIERTVRARAWRLRRDGRAQYWTFERAHRGTLFFDEIGDLPLELKPNILRVMRLDGAATIHTDVRVICATHRRLVEMIDERQVRADLLYWLSVFPIELPPLRKRPEDIRLLVRHFARDYAARMHKRITTISEEFMTASHGIPGRATFGNCKTSLNAR
jgi:transcriptional regulator with GAF, ATPase, and Fis domain